MHLLLTSRNTCAYNGRPNARCVCALSSLVHVYACRVARACEVSSYACGLFAQSASARNTPVAANESGCACVRMRLQFACAFVRMHSHVSMLQPSSSGVMHAKPRGVHGTGQARHDGTSTLPHKKCEHGNARYGLCVQVLLRAGRTSTLRGVDASGAGARLRNSKAPVSADTLYGRKCCDRFPGGSNRPCAAAGIRCGVTQNPGF